jgi:hypothetical protein
MNYFVEVELKREAMWLGPSDAKGVHSLVTRREDAAAFPTRREALRAGEAMRAIMGPLFYEVDPEESGMLGPGA